MLTLTEAAGARLVEILAQEGLPAEVSIRLLPEEDGIGMQADHERPGDATIEHDGRVVLLLDEQMAQLLTNDTLDVEGAKLAITPAEGSD
jgi:Fe-S cluster assembly iron-binding protein IscA